MVTKLVAITGPPCGGKSTHARSLIAGPSHVLISSGEIARYCAATHSGPNLHAVLALGCMYPDNGVIDREVTARIRKIHYHEDDHTVLLDGHPRFGSQLETLMRLAQQYRIHLSLVVVDTPAAICATRAAGLRRSNHDARSALWFGRQLHEIVETAVLNHIPWQVAPGSESPR